MHTFICPQCNIKRTISDDDYRSRMQHKPKHIFCDKGCANKYNGNKRTVQPFTERQIKIAKKALEIGIPLTTQYFNISRHCVLSCVKKYKELNGGKND